jgi:hypothetical protein
MGEPVLMGGGLAELGDGAAQGAPDHLALASRDEGRGAVRGAVRSSARMPTVGSLVRMNQFMGINLRGKSDSFSM